MKENETDESKCGEKALTIGFGDGIASELTYGKGLKQAVEPLLQRNEH